MNWDLADWGDLILRWFHVTAAISWIGSSLYLMWFDRTFPASDRNSRGEAWLIDFSASQLAASMSGAKAEPLRAHIWLKREPTLTWVSGVLLLVMLASIPAKAALLDASGVPLGFPIAALATIAILGLSWLGYDGLYRSPVSRNPMAARIIVGASLAFLLWFLSHFLHGRTTLLLVGAMLGSLMTFNVWWRLVPAMTELEAARKSNRTPDAAICSRACERSRHNSYLIFPTVLLMLGGHYPALYSSRWGWLAAFLLVACLFGVRHMVEGRPQGKPAFLAGLGALIAATFLVATGPPKPTQDSSERVPFASVRDIIHRRCLSCHSATPTDTTFGRAPGEVDFDTPEAIRKHAQRIRLRSVDSLGMPMGPHADMPRAERDLLGRWILEGAELK